MNRRGSRAHLCSDSSPCAIGESIAMTRLSEIHIVVTRCLSLVLPRSIAATVISATLCLPGASTTNTEAISRQSMRVQHEAEAIPSSCVLMGPVEASDGRLSRWMWPFSREGHVERALDNLEDDATELGANLLVQHDKKTVARLGTDAIRGVKFTVFGTAYFCPPELKRNPVAEGRRREGIVISD